MSGCGGIWARRGEPVGSQFRRNCTFGRAEIEVMLDRGSVQFKAELAPYGGWDA